MPSTYVAVFRQVFGQEVDLEMVGFLGRNQVRTLSLKASPRFLYDTPMHWARPEQDQTAD